MLRRAVERDRYGLMAYVLMARDHCTPSDCAAFRSLTDRHQIVANMDERIYDGLIMRYSPVWNAPPPRGGARHPVAALRADDADRQADQCRFSVGGLDPAGQHHDARAGHRAGAIAPRAAAGAGECAAAVTAPGSDAAAAAAARRRPRSRRRRNPRAPRRFSCAPRRRQLPRGRQRLMLSKAGRRSLTSRSCRFISSSSPSAANPSGNSRAGSPNGWQTAKKKGLPLRHIHVTRMTPKRDEELLAGGSLYWVIHGEIAAREKIIAIEPFRDKDGIGRCRLVMQPKVIAVSPRPMRPFQGWRYFTEDFAPPDLGKVRRQRRGDAGADAPRTARSRSAVGRRSLGCRHRRVSAS